MQNKICSKCKEPKPLNSFSKDKTRKDGHHCQCKDCVHKSTIWYGIKNSAKIREKTWRRRKLINRDGSVFLMPDFLILLNQQNKHCKICPQDINLVPDHNHSTGVVRGILCTRCNIRIGWLEKYKDIIQRHLL